MSTYTEPERLALRVCADVGTEVGDTVGGSTPAAESTLLNVLPWPRLGGGATIGGDETGQNTGARVAPGPPLVASPASEIAAQVHARCFDDLDNHVMRVHSADVPTPYASNLEQEYLPNARRIAEAVRSALYVA